MSFITSDWHIHTVASYDAQLHIAELCKATEQLGYVEFGVSDHVNCPSWIHYLRASSELVKQSGRSNIHFGVELTTISGYLEQYDRAHGSSEGYEHPGTPGVDPIAFPLTAEELNECGVEYVIGAEHWLLNAPHTQKGVVSEMQRQNMYCACSPLVDIVGHPYLMYGTFENKLGQQVPYDDFSIIPVSMREEFFAALKQHGKAMELNLRFFTKKYNEKWNREYSEFARAAFEYGIPVTIGTDCHGPTYADPNESYEQCLKAVGFTSADFSRPRFGKRIVTE